MEFRPFFRITVDDQDISADLTPRLVSLQITDGAGVQSDQLQITLSDTQPLARFAEPRAGAEIRVWLGYPLRLQFMGLFIADTIEITGPPDEMVITAIASINGETTSGKTALTDQKTRSWPAGTTVAQLVETIAGEHGLTPLISDSLRAERLPHLDQIDESDMNLLSRIARDLDAIAKPGNGHMILTRRGESRTASGQPMPSLQIRAGQVTNWRYSNSLRERVGRVVATYQDHGRGAPVEVTAGSKSPTQRLKRRFPDAQTAGRAATSELNRLTRAGRRLSLTLPGHPDAVAEARLEATGFRSYVDGEWLITQVVHSLDSGGFSTAITAETL